MKKLLSAFASVDHSPQQPCSPRENASPPFQSILRQRLSRRDTLRGGLGLAATALFASTGLVGCNLIDDDDDDNDGASTSAERPASLTFRSVPDSLADTVVVPEGYSVQALIPWGTPITGTFPPFDAANASNSAEDQAQQMGMHHDGMIYFPLPAGSDTSDRALLAVNNENITQQYLHPNGPTAVNAVRTVPDEVRKEMNAHGVAVVELQRGGDGQWAVAAGGMNRRITAMTQMMLSGPVAATPFTQTVYSPAGTMARGTLNNCGPGYTPWGTYLTCEENWAGYFYDARFDPENPDSLPREKARYGVGPAFFGYAWHTAAGAPGEQNGEFARFDTTPTGTTAADDYRNEASTYGYIVEIDPYDPSAMPVKRTALGRFGHEGCWPGKIEAGKPIAFYMGDDSRFEYTYKFATADAWDPDNPNPDMLDTGTLYVARFNADGSGEWLPLVFGQGPLVAPAFSNQADVLLNTRLAADALGATPMDRPEWSAVHPRTGDIFYTLTNNSDRQDPNASNPRAPNEYGHVIRLRETGGDPAATAFEWEIFVFGAPAGAPADVNRSGLTPDNQFGSPDGLYFDHRGVLWIETDNGGNAVADATNNQLLAVIPGDFGAGGITPGNQDKLKRFLVGPVGCEITGIQLTPDARTLFVNVQHPGQDGTRANPGSTFPSGPGTRPRSATIAIRREDGGPIGTAI